MENGVFFKIKVEFSLNFLIERQAVLRWSLFFSKFTGKHLYWYWKKDPICEWIFSYLIKKFFKKKNNRFLNSGEIPFCFS